MKQGAGGWRPLGVAWVSVLVGVAAAACTPQPRALPSPPAEPPSQGASSGAGPAASDSAWSYLGATGPAEWANLSPDFAACGGPNQSPIDVPLTAVGPAVSFPLELGSLPVEATNDGLGLRLGGAPTMALTHDGMRATLDHLSVHSPAEHQLGGTRADAEIELVFARPGEPSLIVSLLLRVGQPSAPLSAFVGALPSAGRYEAKLLGATLPLTELVPKSASVLVYDGSFTTPPCAPAKRLVVAHVLELSSEQLATLRTALGGDNARPVQPLGERTVTAYSGPGADAVAPTSAAPTSAAPTSATPPPAASSPKTQNPAPSQTATPKPPAPKN